MRYFLVVAGEDNAFVVEAYHFQVFEGWLTFIGDDDRVVTSLSPGGNFYFKELTAEEYEDMIEELGEEEPQEDDSESEESLPSFAEYLAQAREDAKPIFKEG